MSLEEILDTQDATPAHDGITAARLRFADAAEALLRNIFATLGARNAHTFDVADVLSGLGAWLALLMTMTRFREGDAAVIWLDARRVAWERGQSLSPDAARREANDQADAAVHDFYQRFPPSLDTRDAEIEAMQEEVHGLRALADAAEERAEKAEHELAELRALVANGVLISQPKPERVEPGQRWALIAHTYMGGPPAVVVGPARYKKYRDSRKIIELHSKPYTVQGPTLDTLINDGWIYLGPVVPTAEA